MDRSGTGANAIASLKKLSAAAYLSVFITEACKINVLHTIISVPGTCARYKA